MKEITVFVVQLGLVLRWHSSFAQEPHTYFLQLQHCCLILFFWISLLVVLFLSASVASTLLDVGSFAIAYVSRKLNVFAAFWHAVSYFPTLTRKLRQLLCIISMSLAITNAFNEIIFKRLKNAANGHCRDSAFVL